MDYATYQATVVQALADLYAKTLTYLPNLIVAIIVVIIGWLLAIFLSKLVYKILEVIKIDQLANQLGLRNLSEKVDHKLSLAALGAWIVKWFFFLASFIAAADILGLQEVSTFLYQDVLGYAGHVVVAMAILLLGILAANFFAGIVVATVKASGLHKGESLGVITKWAILIFTAIAALSQLQIATAFLQDLFRAIVAMLAIAGGLAFGLGGRDHAKKILDGIENGLKS
jgi:Conserved TM helix